MRADSQHRLRKRANPATARSRRPPPRPAPPLPDWAKNGSFLVYRRLRQDVAAFQQFIAAHAAPLGLPPAAVGAKLVGRWASGAPLELVHGENADRTPEQGD